jgi:uncharacterized membrane protein
MPTHPQIVHFPVSLFIVAFLLEITSYFWKKEMLSFMSLILLVLGTLAAFIAVQTGQAAETTAKIIPGISTLLHEHEEAAETVFYLYLGITVFKAGLMRFKKDILPWRFLILAGLLAGTFLLYQAAYYGGKLVYDWGAGVKPVLEQHQNE